MGLERLQASCANKINPFFGVIQRLSGQERKLLEKSIVPGVVSPLKSGLPAAIMISTWCENHTCTIEELRPWQIVYADSEELVAEPGNADNIIDEQPVTFWHTQYQDGRPGHPHQVVIDLGQVAEFKALSYLPRNGSNPGKIKGFRIYGRKTLFEGLEDNE
jgi:F5/8 type C domain